MHDVFILGAGGFIGREVVLEAIARGLKVAALSRSEEQARWLQQVGATPIIGDVRASEQWAERLAGVRVVLDLIQPRLPSRLSRAAMLGIAAERMIATRSLLGALAALSPHERPLLLSVSGMADLVKDERGVLSASSSYRTEPTGFAQIGVPVHDLVQRSGLPTAFVHLGTVYGPGKAFAARLLPDLARGKMPIIGKGENRLALIHVRDAARALVQLTMLDTEKLSGKTWLLADGAGTKQREFLQHAAQLMNGPTPRKLPRWLVSLVAGSAVADQMTEDAPVDISPLLGTGFKFEYPSHHTGLPATVKALLEVNQ
jgi:nucleoside-diphosphate-sugar epimerase